MLRMTGAEGRLTPGSCYFFLQSFVVPHSQRRTKMTVGAVNIDREDYFYPASGTKYV
jgi:hypothetical protein